MLHLHNGQTGGESESCRPPEGGGNSLVGRSPRKGLDWRSGEERMDSGDTIKAEAPRLSKSLNGNGKGGRERRNNIQVSDLEGKKQIPDPHCHIDSGTFTGLLV